MPSASAERIGENLLGRLGCWIEFAPAWWIAPLALKVHSNPWAYNQPMGSPEFIVLIAPAILLFGTRRIALGQGPRPGGPQPPTQPLPGNDSRILNRRRPETE
jgi:hypothetical protein